MFKKQDENQLAGKIQTDKPLKTNDELEKKCEEYLNSWKRSQADYLNLQKTVERERSEWVRFSNQGIFMEILPIYEHLKLAMKHVPEEQSRESWVVGIVNIKNQFGKFLTDNGVEEIKTVGQDFNPEEHEAVAVAKEENNEHQGKIKEELRGGYKLNGKVLYPARVIVE